MTWYYADAGRQLGPIEEAALDDLARAGTVRDDTLVWCEGMTTWQPHGSVRGTRPMPPLPDMPYATSPVTIGQVPMVRRYGGFWVRFVARVIDGVILGVVGLVIRAPFALTLGLSPRGFGASAIPMMFGMVGISTLLQIALGVGYEAYFLSTRGATLGKMALGLKVIRADGSGIPAGLAVGRYFAQWISAIIFAIGYIMAAFDPEKRALHDRICETRVIYEK
jgi:uncharacterized RDD family membrane protein YckC